MSEDNQNAATDASQFHGACETFLLEDRNFNFKWKINNIRQLIEIYEKGEKLSSDVFNVHVNGGCFDFMIELYPCGENSSPVDGITIFITPAKVDPNVRKHEFSAKLHILDDQSNASLGGASSSKFHPLIGLAVGRNYNFKRITYVDLFSTERKLIVNDSLTLVLNVRVKSADTVNKSVIVVTDKHVQETNHAKDMKDMLEHAEQYYSDMVIKCSDGNVACHANVVAARSEYFCNMLSTNMKEGLSKRVEKQCWTKSLCFTILEYLYTGNIKANKINLKLFEEADKMNMIDLKDECCNQLIKDMNLSNCVPSFCIAALHKADTLKEAAKKFCVNNFDKLSTKSKNDLKKQPDLLMEIVDHLRIQLPTPSAKRRRLN